jgi:GMP synthase (glutamine-hydrolysing)
LLLFLRILVIIFLGCIRGLEEKAGVVVVDFGGQYAHLIARRLRELETFSILVSAEWGLEEIRRNLKDVKVKGVVLSGGPNSVWETSHDLMAKWAISLGVPVLGICYGHQLLAKILGGEVGRAPKGEFGPTLVEVLEEDTILKGHGKTFRAWMSHNDAVLKPPPGSKVLARSAGSPIAAFCYNNRIYGVQWHPEVRHTEHGQKLLRNWLQLTGALGTWRPKDVIKDIINEIRETIGDAKAIAAVSGGVDSTVAAVLAKKAIGDNLVPVFIDHGLHPDGEVERALNILKSCGLRPLVVNASKRFLEALRGVTDPEEKRRVVGELYGRILEEVAEGFGAEYLIQGTIYPDVIESGRRPGADVIKTHHNVGGLPKDLKLKIVEPLKWFYKDEVRAIASSLGLPEELWKFKQPVPGPGLAVRIEGEVTEEKLEVLKKADRIVREEIESRGLHKSLWQYFAILTSSKATGVKGDRRAYGYVIVVRVVESTDAMTASVARLPWNVLESISSRITGEISSVTRVLYDITPKPPATIEWE